MNNRFDELAKNMAQSVTRRGALKKFGIGIEGSALAALGLPNKAQAAKAVPLPVHEVPIWLPPGRQPGVLHLGVHLSMPKEADLNLS